VNVDSILNLNQKFTWWKLRMCSDRQTGRWTESCECWLDSKFKL